VIREHAVVLFRHRAIERAQPSFVVRDLHLQLGCGERRRQRRVRVAVHDHEVRAMLLDRLLEAEQHATGLLGVRARPDAEVDVRRAQPEFVEEHL